MKIKELTVTAVIPTAQYANLQPSVTVEVDNDYEEAKKAAMAEIAKFSSEYAEDGKAISSGKTSDVKQVEMIPDIGDVSLFFDAASHTYVDENEKLYESGSQFAHKFAYPFDSAQIAPKYAEKFGLRTQEVIDFWKSKADASTTFGTALHQALETESKYKKLAELLNTEEKPVTTGLHPTLQPIVDAFFTPERLAEETIDEAFVSSKELGRCGQIDRLVIVDREKKTCIIDDYKTNGDLYKERSQKYLKAPYNKTGFALPNQPIGEYMIQLNFYGSILKANGWTVLGRRLWWWAGTKWEMIELQEVET